MINHKDYNNEFLLPWSHHIYSKIVNSLSNKKNLIFVGLSFWKEDRWEILKYIELFVEGNKKGNVFWLVYDKNDSIVEVIIEEVIKIGIDKNRINFIYGSFKDNYQKIFELM